MEITRSVKLEEGEEEQNYCVKNRHLWVCDTKGNITNCIVCQMLWSQYKKENESTND